MLEKIVLIGELRSGGKWLKSVFDPDHYMDLREFFSPLPQNGVTKDGYKSHVHAGHKLIDILVPILKFSNINKDLISSIHDVLISLKVVDNGSINSNFSTIENCQLIINTFNQLNKGSIVKILPSLLFLATDTRMQQFVESSNLCIRFYRKNVLNLYISHMKALTSGCWSKKEAAQANIDKNNLKIRWDTQQYINYFQGILFSYQYLSQCNFRNSVLVSYEEIHEAGMTEKEKLEFVTEKFQSISPNLTIIPNSVLKDEIKEANVIELEDNFSNKEDFIKSQSDIPIYLPDSV